MSLREEWEVYRRQTCQSVIILTAGLLKGTTLREAIDHAMREEEPRS